jgi:hypothetical protein
MLLLSSLIALYCEGHCFPFTVDLEPDPVRKTRRGIVVEVNQIAGIDSEIDLAGNPAVLLSRTHLEPGTCRHRAAPADQAYSQTTVETESADNSGQWR